MPNNLKNSSFAFGDHDRAFISSMIHHGHFRNKTEVVRAGLRLLQDCENNQNLQRLRSQIALSDADVSADRMREYDTADELINDVINEGVKD